MEDPKKPNDKPTEPKKKPRSEPKTPPKVEEIKTMGDHLLDTVDKIIKDGCAQRITVMKGPKLIVEIPLVAGVIGALLFPATTLALAALSGIALAFADEYTVRIERKTD